MRKRSFIVLIGTVVLLLGLAVPMMQCAPSGEVPEHPSQNSEGIVVRLTLDELAAEADSILVGEVTNIACYEEGEGHIYTLVTLKVEQTIKGTVQEEAMIKVPGGVMGELELVAEDMPSFRLGERVVVFLEESECIFGVVGCFQGKSSIDDNDMVGNFSLTEVIDQIRDILAKQ